MGIATRGTPGYGRRRCTEERHVVTSLTNPPTADTAGLGECRNTCAAEKSA